jgi:uncharacterized membrane protein
VPTSPRPWHERAARWASIAAELVLVALGIAFLSTDDGELPLALWCLIGTLYCVASIVGLTVSAVRRPLSEPPQVRRAVPRLEYAVSVLSTLFASLVGVWAAIQLVLLRSSTTSGSAALTGFELLGVWAMLLSWGLLHWGIAQAYRYLYYSRSERPLRFPDTDYPKMVDFAYFAFGIGTSFAVSDVETRGSRMRWTVLWHSTLSFFFNGLIIVLALNIVMDTGH